MEIQKIKIKFDLNIVNNLNEELWKKNKERKQHFTCTN